MSKNPFFALLSMLILASLILAACVTPAAPTTEVPAQAPATQAPATLAPATEAPAATASTSSYKPATNQPKKIAFFVSDLTNVFHQGQATEAKKYAKEKYGAEVFVFDGKSDSATMTANIDQVVAQGMDAATLHIWDFEAATPGVLDALDKGIIIPRSSARWAIRGSRWHAATRRVFRLPWAPRWPSSGRPLTLTSPSSWCSWAGRTIRK